MHYQFVWLLYEYTLRPSQIVPKSVLWLTIKKFDWATILPYIYIPSIVHSIYHMYVCILTIFMPR